MQLLTRLASAENRADAIADESQDVGVARW
jgi:hypothetical protein